MVGLNLDYISIREEYYTISDKTKAYTETYNKLNEQLKHRTQGKSWKIKNLIVRKTLSHD